MRPVTRAVLASATVLAAPAVASAAQVIPDAGVRIAPGPAADLCREARIAKQAGIPWVSTGVSWESLEPEPDAYLAPGSAASRRLGDLEAFLACSKGLGLNVQLIVTNPPAWVSGRSGSDDPPRAADIPQYGPFLSDIGARLAPYVDAWTPWNEPNFEFQWAKPHDPARYVAIQKVAYPALKQVDPTALVTSAPIVGSATGSATYAWDYLAAMYREGLRGNADVIGFNFYPRQAPETAVVDSRGNPATYALPSQTYLRELVDRFDPGRPIWIMETGHSTCVNCNASAPNAVGESTQADYLLRMFTYRRRYLQGVTDKIFWYNLRDLNADRSDWFGQQGLLRNDLTPKPAFGVLPQLLVEVPDPPGPGAGPVTSASPSTPPIPLPVLPVSERRAPLPAARTVAGRRLVLGRPGLVNRRGRITVSVVARVSAGRAVVRIQAYRLRRWRTIRTVVIPRSARVRVAFPDLGYLGVRVLARPVGVSRWVVSRVVRVTPPRAVTRRR